MTDTQAPAPQPETEGGKPRTRRRAFLILGIVVAHGDLFEYDVTLDGDIAGRGNTIQYDIGHQINSREH